MTHRLRTALLLALLATSHLASLAHASTLPAPYGLINGTIDSPGNISPLQEGFAPLTAYWQGSRGTALATVTNHVPSVGTSSTGYAGASAVEYYYFQINGPAATQAPLTVSGFVNAIVENANSYSYSIAETAFWIDEPFPGQKNNPFWVSPPNPPEGDYGYARGGPTALAANSACAGFCDPGWSASHGFDESLMIKTNEPYLVTMVAGVMTTDYGWRDGTLARALVDPTFTIDPSWLFANPGYSLEVSPGLDNGKLATPLPPALALYGTGILALITFAWHRRRSRLPPQAPSADSL